MDFFFNLVSNLPLNSLLIAYPLDAWVWSKMTPVVVFLQYLCHFKFLSFNLSCIPQIGCLWHEIIWICIYLLYFLSYCIFCISTPLFHTWGQKWPQAFSMEFQRLSLGNFDFYQLWLSGIHLLSIHTSNASSLTTLKVIFYTATYISIIRFYTS